MSSLLARVRARLSFANVTSALALFVALGGTSYAAISLPRNSVGSSQIRTGAVGKSEIRTGAVGAWEIRGGAVGRSEIRSNAVGKSEIRSNAVGDIELLPNAVTNAKIAPDAVDGSKIKDGSVDAADLAAAVKLGRASVSGPGALTGGNAKSVSHVTGVYTVEFDRDVSKCQYAATLADPANPANFVAAAPGTSNTQVVVTTRNDATPTDAPFNLIVACG